MVKWLLQLVNIICGYLVDEAYRGLHISVWPFYGIQHPQFWTLIVSLIIRVVSTIQKYYNVFVCPPKSLDMISIEAIQPIAQVLRTDVWIWRYLFWSDMRDIYLLICILRRNVRINRYCVIRLSFVWYAHSKEYEPRKAWNVPRYTFCYNTFCETPVLPLPDQLADQLQPSLCFNPSAHST